MKWWKGHSKPTEWHGEWSEDGTWMHICFNCRGLGDGPTSPNSLHDTFLMISGEMPQRWVGEDYALPGRNVYMEHYGTWAFISGIYVPREEWAWV